MAEEEEEKIYKLTKPDGTVTKTSREYTGQGFAEYSNQDSFEGMFANGIREGKGKYNYSNGDKYDGEFQKNLKHGIGKMVYKVQIDEDTNTKKGGGEYYGHWENGQKHGEGIFTYLNKDVYSGWWKYGIKQGKGTYIFNDTQMRVIKQLDQLANGKMDKYFQENGFFPMGQSMRVVLKIISQMGKQLQKGKWYFKNGNIQEGNYLQKQVENDDNPVNNYKFYIVKKDEKKTLLEWNSAAKLFESAKQINSIENI